jgi:hypothetical protein
MSDFTADGPVYVAAADASGAGTGAVWSFGFHESGDFAAHVRVTDRAGNQHVETGAVTIGPAV